MRVSLLPATENSTFHPESTLLRGGGYLEHPHSMEGETEAQTGKETSSAGSSGGAGV